MKRLLAVIIGILFPCFIVFAQVPTENLILKKFCTAKTNDKYDCEDMTINNIEAFLDVGNLPSFNNDLQQLVLVDSPEHYGYGEVMISLFYPSLHNPKIKLDENFQKKLLDSQPIKVHIKNAIIRKVIQPGGFETFHLETDTLENVSFYKVKADSTEELIER